MAYQLRHGVEQTPFYNGQLFGDTRDTLYDTRALTLSGKEDPWKRVPSFIIDRIKQEQRKRERPSDDQRPQPILYDNDYQPLHQERKNDEERGVVIVDTTVTSSESSLEQML